MSFESYTGPRDTFALHGKRAVQLQSDGIYHPRSPKAKDSVFTPYEDVTHLATSDRALWLGTRDSVFVLPRKQFANPGAPEDIVRSLLAVLSHRPGGAAQLARMGEVERLAQSTAVVRVTWILAALCFAVFALQLVVGQEIWNVGYFSVAFLRDGDLWRIVTGNLLHGVPEFPLHLALNMLALVGLGNLVERVLGPARVVCVMGVAGICAMLAGGLETPGMLVGASGIVFGLAGASLWLEFNCAERLPAWLRIPRRSMFFFLAINGLIMFTIPFVSGGAHIGGFLGGLGATALLTGPQLGRVRAPLPVQLAAALVGVATVAAIGAAGWDAFGRGNFDARFNTRLAGLPNVSPRALNDRAWEIAIDPESSYPDMQAALLLAERAVMETNRLSPTILDTLAEVQFQLGQPELASETILEAIAREPLSSYYREQLRRFIGERDSDDRPEYSPFPSGPRRDPLDIQERGLTV